MTYKGGTHYIAPDWILFEIDQFKDEAEDWHTKNKKPFDSKDYCEGYRQACQDIYDMLKDPIPGVM